MIKFFTLTHDFAKIGYFGYHCESHLMFYFGFNKTLAKNGFLSRAYVKKLFQVFLFVCALAKPKKIVKKFPLGPDSRCVSCFGD